MKSGYSIVWSDEALTNLNAIIDYLTIKWTDKEIRNFYRKLDKQLNLLSGNPYLFPASFSKKKYRKSVLSEQTSIYYEIKEHTIVVLSLFDNRKDPKTITNK